MATPLYKRFKKNGTTLYVFPSAAYDDNLSSAPNSNFKLNFSKFVCLNFPEKKGRILDFNNNEFQCSSPLTDADFADSMINSLRNYVANADSTFHNSRVGDHDFYNIQEITTPTEMIFWKWIKKLNVIDYEPAQNKIDWDKYDPDFKNTNPHKSTDNDYFQKYLWKEREVRPYESVSIEETSSSTREYRITFNEMCKFRSGDYLVINKTITGRILSDPTDVLINRINKTTVINIQLDSGFSIDPSDETQLFELDYKRFVQYIGEVDVESYVQTGKMNHKEITVYMQNHAGQTPSVLFGIDDNNKNYYPNLELPIMESERTNRILGADNFNSPIVTNPSEYPGNYYGIFDKDISLGDFTSTYKVSEGDSERYNGPYYGIDLNENTYTEDEDYFESLNDFDSRQIDGVKLDFDINHYYKAKFGKQNITNFDEFNSANLDEEPPKDFDFNAILWYYTVDNGTEKVENLYGIEFINNPNDDFDDDDNEGNLITPNRKYVSNGEQDGVCYIYNLLTHIDVDNNPMPLAYNPDILNNSTGFDLYNNILKTNLSLYDNFQTILMNQERYNSEMEKMKSLIYTQTELNIIKSRIDNLDTLLNLYSKMQMADSDTIKIEIDDDGNYPKLKAHVRQKEYSDVLTFTTTELLSFVRDHKKPFPIKLINKPLILIKNDIKSIRSSTDTLQDIEIDFTRDLATGESFDILIEPNGSTDKSRIKGNIYFEGENLTYRYEQIFDIKLPADLTSLDPIKYANSYYSNVLLEEYASFMDVTENNRCKIWSDTLHIPLFQMGDQIYVDNLFVKNEKTDEVIDYSGAYTITGVGFTHKNFYYYEIDLSSNVLENSTLYTYPRLTYYKGVKYNILRVDPLLSSTKDERYRIKKELLN